MAQPQRPKLPAGLADADQLSPDAGGLNLDTPKAICLMERLKLPTSFSFGAIEDCCDVAT
jgi:hypothetical protein